MLTSSDYERRIGFYYSLLVVLAHEMPNELKALADRQVDKGLTRQVGTSLRVPRRIEVARLFAAVELDAMQGGNLVDSVLDGDSVPELKKRAALISDRLGKCQRSYEEAGSKFRTILVESFVERFKSELSQVAIEWLAKSRRSLPSLDESTANLALMITLLRGVVEPSYPVKRATAFVKSVERGSVDAEPSAGPATSFGYREIEASAVYVYRQRTPSRVIVRRTIQAIAEPVIEFDVPFNLPNDLRDNIGSLRVISNCSVLRYKFIRSTGTAVYSLRLPKATVREPVAFSYEMEINSDVDDRPYLRHFARAPGQHFVLEAQFDRDYLPSKVSSFERLDYWADVEAAPTTQAVLMSEEGCARAEFFDYSPPETFGIVFEWDD